MILDQRRGICCSDHLAASQAAQSQEGGDAADDNLQF